MQPIWKDRVWVSLLLGPLLWAGIAMPLTGWPQEGGQLLALYAQGMCVSVATVSVFLPTIRGRTASKGSH
jgi:hypothetical protein